MSDTLKNLSQHKEAIEKDISALRKEISVLEETGFSRTFLFHLQFS